MSICWLRMLISKFTILFSLMTIFFFCSSAACPGGWFGDKCQYLCHCDSSCDNTGECAGRGRCKSGWFGPQCQYNDLATNATVTGQPPLYSNWLTDRDDFLCNTNPELQTITFTWKQSNPLTWFRLVTYDLSLLLSLKVSFKNLSQPSFQELTCDHQQVIVSGDRTIDIYCDMKVTAEQMILRNVKSLCSVYISGGRNFAIKQQTSQSSTYTEMAIRYESWKAVDGDTHQMFNNRSCTHTNTNDHAPHWTLTFDHPIVAKTFYLYNRHDPSDYTGHEILPYRLKNFLLVTKNGLHQVILNYKDPLSTAQSIYRVIYIRNQPIVEVQISATNIISMDTTPILTLCEVEIYGECPFGTWGLACDKACPAECSDWCHQGDGSCNTVCGGQSDPPLCTKSKRNNCAKYQLDPRLCVGEIMCTNVLPDNCVSTKWGLNCASSCSDHCVDQLCHRLTGECSQGCHGYEDPPLCTQACQPGYWGENCTQLCSPHCDQVICNGQTKECLNGCKEGFQLPDCTLQCPEGFHGKNCSNICPFHCLNGLCDPVTGYCRSCAPGFQEHFCDQECNVGFWGDNCSQLCSNHCDQLKCNGQTGECLHGCQEGYQLPNCTTSCQQGFFGKNCSSKCSSNCTETQCDPLTGVCLSCHPGVQGHFCDQECNPGFWGDNCKLKCSNHCYQVICDGQTGECQQGCQEGYQLPNCTTVCLDNVYGRNCSLSCSNHCVDAKCNGITGLCFECLPGFLGGFCEQECPPKFYGQDCVKKCNDSCIDQLCHPQTGDCFNCFIGKGGPQCDDCPLGTYGDNCAMNCSSICKLGTGCDPMYGTCFEGN